MNCLKRNLDDSRLLMQKSTAHSMCIQFMSVNEKASHWLRAEADPETIRRNNGIDQ
jgi:hypothetical protein